MGFDHPWEEELHLELQSITDHRPPIRTETMERIIRLAHQHKEHYKHVVAHVLKFLAMCKPEYKLSAFYVIDAVARKAESSKDPKRRYAGRIEQQLDDILKRVLQCAPSDRSQVKRAFGLWIKNSVFPASADKIQKYYDSITENEASPDRASATPPPVNPAAAIPASLSALLGLAPPPAQPMAAQAVPMFDSKQIADFAQLLMPVAAAPPLVQPVQPVAPPAQSANVAALLQLLGNAHAQATASSQPLLPIPMTTATPAPPQRRQSEFDTLSFSSYQSGGQSGGQKPPPLMPKPQSAPAPVPMQQPTRQRTTRITIKKPVPTNVLYIGGILTDGELTAPQIQQYCEQFGPVDSVRAVPNIGAAFVRFKSRQSAENALQSMQQGGMLGRVAKAGWGREFQMIETVFNKATGIGIMDVTEDVPTENLLEVQQEAETAIRQFHEELSNGPPAPSRAPREQHQPPYQQPLQQQHQQQHQQQQQYVQQMPVKSWGGQHYQHQQHQQQQQPEQSYPPYHHQPQQQQQQQSQHHHHHGGGGPQSYDPLDVWVDTITAPTASANSSTAALDSLLSNARHAADMNASKRSADSMDSYAKRSRFDEGPPTNDSGQWSGRDPRDGAFR